MLDKISIRFRLDNLSQYFVKFDFNNEDSQRIIHRQYNTERKSYHTNYRYKYFEKKKQI